MHLHERANAELLLGLKTRSFGPLKNKGAKWITEVQAILWSLCTAPSRTTAKHLSSCYTVRKLSYHQKSYIMPTHLAFFEESAQDECHIDDIDFLEQSRHRVVVRNARYQQSLRRYHQRHLTPNALGWCPSLMSRLDASWQRAKDKLSPMWEGPFLVTKVSCPGSV